jgi:hypothetical protein
MLSKAVSGLRWSQFGYLPGVDRENQGIVSGVRATRSHHTKRVGGLLFHPSAGTTFLVDS